MMPAVSSWNMGRASGEKCDEWLGELVSCTGSSCFHLLQEVDFVSEAQVPASHAFHKHSDCNARVGIIFPSMFSGQVVASSMHVNSLASNSYACSIVVGGEKSRWGLCSSYLRDSYNIDEEFFESLQQLRAHLIWLRVEKASFLIVGSDA